MKTLLILAGLIGLLSVAFGLSSCAQQTPPHQASVLRAPELAPKDDGFYNPQKDWNLAAD